MKTSVLEYHKTDVPVERLWVLSAAKRLENFLDHMMTGAVIILVIAIVSFACIKVGKSGIISARYCDVCTQAVFIP